MTSKLRTILMLFIGIFFIVIITNYLFPIFVSQKVSTEIKIAVIPKGEQTTFWQAVKKGAESFNEQKVEDKKITILWTSPPIEDNEASQISQVEKFIQSPDELKISDELSVSGIVIAPLDKNALLKPIVQAKDNGILVVIMDSGLSGEITKDYDAFVATDNYEAGKDAGKELAKVMREQYEVNKNNKVKIWIQGFRQSSASTTRREKGFIKQITEEFPKIDRDKDIVYDEDIFDESDSRKGSIENAAVKASLKLIHGDEKKTGILKNFNEEANTPLGIFSSNETTTIGMFEALKKEEIAGKIPFVGFDISKDLYEGLINNQINTLMIQDAEEIGRKSVEKLIELLRENENNFNKDERIITIPIKVINTNNIEEEESKKLLSSYEISP